MKYPAIVWKPVLLWRVKWALRRLGQRAWRWATFYHWRRRRMRRKATDRRIWITAKGTHIHVTDMSDSHLLHARRYLERHGHLKSFDSRWPGILELEITGRGLVDRRLEHPLPGQDVGGGDTGRGLVEEETISSHDEGPGPWGK